MPFPLAGPTGATRRYPRFATVWMNVGSRASSSNTRRNSWIERLSTSSLTKVPGQTTCSMLSLETDWPGCSARHTKTSITFGSRCTVVPLRETALRFGSTRQGPTWKFPSMATTPVNAEIINPSVPFSAGFRRPTCKLHPNFTTSSRHQPTIAVEIRLVRHFPGERSGGRDNIADQSGGCYDR